MREREREREREKETPPISPMPIPDIHLVFRRPSVLFSLLSLLSPPLYCKTELIEVTADLDGAVHSFDIGVGFWVDPSKIRIKKPRSVLFGS